MAAPITRYQGTRFDPPTRFNLLSPKVRSRRPQMCTRVHACGLSGHARDPFKTLKGKEWGSHGD